VSKVSLEELYRVKYEVQLDMSQLKAILYWLFGGSSAEKRKVFSSLPNTRTCPEVENADEGALR
jgi:hypothetical protein